MVHEVHEEICGIGFMTLRYIKRVWVFPLMTSDTVRRKPLSLLICLQQIRSWQNTPNTPQETSTSNVLGKDNAVTYSTVEYTLDTLMLLGIGAMKLFLLRIGWSLGFLQVIWETPCWKSLFCVAVLFQMFAWIWFICEESSHFRSDFNSDFGRDLPIGWKIPNQNGALCGTIIELLILSTATVFRVGW